MTDAEWSKIIKERDMVCQFSQDVIVELARHIIG